MADPMSGPVVRCPWCSAPLPADPGATCPSCGATLAGAEGSEPQVPGLTTIDAEAILRARSETSRPRSRILSFITGDLADESLDPTEAASIAPPSDEVRREMLRLQLEAERAELEHQIALAEAQARLEGRAPAAVEPPEDAEAPGDVAMSTVAAPAEEVRATDEPPADRSAL